MTISDTFEEWWTKQDVCEFTGIQAKHVEAAFFAGCNYQKQRDAEICREIVEYPPGTNGQWEGYGVIKMPRDGLACAIAILNQR